MYILLITVDGCFKSKIAFGVSLFSIAVNVLRFIHLIGDTPVRLACKPRLGPRPRSPATVMGRIRHLRRWASDLCFFSSHIHKESQLTYQASKLTSVLWE